MLGVGIVTGLGILLGLIFLIIPGIVLGLRWSISVPYALADGHQGVGDAISRSWQSTQRRGWPIFLALLPWYGMIAGGIFALGFLEGMGANNMAGIVAFNLCVSLGVVAAWYAAVAIYVLVERPEGLTEVFA
jgi:membrane-anchored glycerophosphoryl diester phosphodiesterase (GDPDase)